MNSVAGRIAILVALAILLAAAVLIGQAAFRLDRTLFRHGYTQRLIDSLLAPLDGDDIHEEFIGAVVRELQRSLDWGIPAGFRPLVVRAAADSFSPSWIRRTAKGTHTAFHRLMKHQTVEPQIVVSLGSFMAALTNEARAAFDEETAAAAAQAQISQLPSSIDVWAVLDDEPRTAIERWIRRLPSTSILLQYALPALFIAFAFLPRRPGSALITVGIGVAAGGAAALILVQWFGAGLAARAARLASSAIPGNGRWIEQPVAVSVLEIVRSGRGFAALLVGIGVVLIGCGIVWIRRWGDSFSIRSAPLQ